MNPDHEAAEDCQEPPPDAIGLNIYGIKATVRPGEVPPPPKNLRDLKTRACQYLLAFADGCMALLPDGITAGRGLLRGIARLPLALARRIEVSTEAADKAEASRQEVSVAAKNPILKNTAIDHLRDVIDELRAAGIPVEVHKIENQKVVFTLTPPDVAPLALAEAKEAIAVEAKILEIPE
jgi:hypothetical protein